MSSLEIAANAVMLVAVFLAARNHWMTWPLGVIGCLLFGVLFFQSQLYADVTLQIFFVATNIAGWIMWKKPQTPSGELPITRMSLHTIFFILFPLAVLTAFIYGTLLAHTTDAHLPIIDSLVLTFSIVAQFLLMGRKIETWMFWMIVDIIAIPLFASKGLYLTSFVYGLFLVNAVYGFLSWRAEMKNASI